MGAAAIPIIMGVTGAASIGANIYAANKQAGAAKEAASQQTAAGQQALDLQKQIWQQQQTNLQPWLTQGSRAVNTLGALMGLGAGEEAAAAPAAPTNPSMLSYTPMARPQPSPPPTTLGALESPANPDYWKQHPVLDAESRFQFRQAQSQSSYVPMKAPDGTTQDVPPHLVKHYTSLGAQVLN